jgi:anti-anti-sigma factor
VPTIQSQVRKGAPFTIEGSSGKTAGTVIFRLKGPFTARDMFNSQSPDAVRNLFEFHSSSDDAPPALNILDFSEVPYMDSMGLGTIVAHYVRCKSKGIRVIVAAASPRVLELLRLTKVESVLPLAVTVEEAEGAR